MKLRLIMLLLLICVSAPLCAEIPVRGDVHFYSGLGTSERDFVRNAVSGDLVFRKSFDKTSVYVDLKAEYDTAQGSDAILSLYGSGSDPENYGVNSSYVESENESAQQRVYLNEAYINQDFYVKDLDFIDSFTLKTGKIIYRWGYSEYFSPLDIINPQDYSFHVLKPIRERKTGVYSISPLLYFSRNFFMQGIINPIFEADNEFSSSFEHSNTRKFYSTSASYNGYYNGTDKPGASLADAAYAGRLGLLLKSFEGHLIYYRGYDHSPIYTVSNVSTTSAAIKREYKQLNMVGFDFMANLVWDINLKGEAAYYHTGKYFEYSGGNGYKESKLIDYILGLEIVKNSFLFNFEFNQNILIDHDSKFLDKQRMHNFLAEIQYRFASNQAYLKNSSLFNLEDKDLGAQFELGLKPEKNYVIRTGYWLFHPFDEETGFMGQYDKNDFLYFAGDLKF